MRWLQEGSPPSPPTAAEAFTEAFGEESRQEAFQGWIKEVRDTELWWVGVSLSLLGSMLATMGLNLQRYSHRVEAAKPLAERLPYYRQKPWISVSPPPPPPAHTTASPHSSLRPPARHRMPVLAAAGADHVSALRPHVHLQSALFWL